MRPIETRGTVAWELRLAASRGQFDGVVSDANQAYLTACTRLHRDSGTVLIYTRDAGHHTSGWFKNPDFERCRHLSLSFVEPGRPTEPRPRDLTLSRVWLNYFFTDTEQRLLWGEPPATLKGKAREVWHYRLFCDAYWEAIRPRGEVYSTEFTERGWKSHSELFGTPEPVSPLYPG
jgi:hypothetical protein